MYRYQTLCSRCGVLAVLLIIFVTTQAYAAPRAFTYVSGNENAKRLPSSSLESSNLEALSVDSWQVRLNKQISELEQGSDLELAMPDGELINASVISNNKLHNGDVQLQARFGEHGHIILTMGSVVSFGSITSADYNYSLSVDKSNSSILIDLQTLPASSTDLSNDTLVPQALEHSAKQSIINSVDFDELRAQANTADETNLDILFIYSSEFRELFSSPETRINQLIAFSNASFQNTGILINMRMAGAVELAFSNSDSNFSLLNAASSSTGMFSGVSQMRDNFGADLVAVLGESNPNSASGVAFVLDSRNDSNDRFNSGYSFTRLSATCCDTVFTHEIGHNLGSGHEGPLVNASADISRCNGGFTGFSCGHGNTEPEGDTPVWGTIMSNIRAPSFRDPNARAVIGYRFSNLDNTCVGEPCGIAPNLPGPEQAADNRTSFNMSRILVGSFRDPVEPSPAPVPEVSDECAFFIIKSANNAASIVCL